MSRFKGLSSVAVPVLALLLWASGEAPAIAATFSSPTYYFTLGNTSGTGGIANNNTVTSPYATLDITVDDTLGTVTFVLNNYNPNTATMGAFGFNSNVITLDDISSVTRNTFAVAVDENQSLDGFGKFTIAAGPNGNVNSIAPPVTIVVTLETPSLATLENVTAQSTQGNALTDNYFALEYFPLTNPSVTGWVAVTSLLPPPDPDVLPAPEPTSLAIWCLGMVAAGIGARRMRKRK
jgi:hypothetical protein